MCLIIAQKPDTALVPTERIANAFLSNSDGAGIAFVDGKDRVWVHKPIYSLPMLLDLYKWAHDGFGKDSPIILHMRIATHGGITEGNTHPHFIAQRSAALAHNGILNVKVPVGSGDSDTVTFIKAGLEQMRLEKLKSPKRLERLGRIIGTTNKFAIVTNERDLLIVNEGSGHWDHGVWYSNYSYNRVRSWIKGSAASDDDWDTWWTKRQGAGWAQRRSTPNGSPAILCGPTDVVPDDDSDIIAEGEEDEGPVRPRGHHISCVCDKCCDFYAYEFEQDLLAESATLAGTEGAVGGLLTGGEDGDPYAGDVDDMGESKPKPTGPVAGSGFLGMGD